MRKRMNVCVCLVVRFFVCVCMCVFGCLYVYECACMCMCESTCYSLMALVCVPMRSFCGWESHGSVWVHCWCDIACGMVCS